MGVHLTSPFPGIATLLAQQPSIVAGRLALMCLGFILAYAGYRQVLEPLLMIPMGLGMIAVNAGVLFLSGSTAGTLFVNPMIGDATEIVNVMQVNFLQPIYNLTFSNGLIACLVFMGIGCICDVGYILARPFSSMFIAICAELGTMAVLPIGIALGLHPREAASIAMVGGADGPMVLYTSLVLAKHLFVPITVVAYLYLSLTYAGYPYIVRLLIPKKYRGIEMDVRSMPTVLRREKFIFAVVTCFVLCLLFPVAAPLFVSFFLGVAVKEAGITEFVKLLEGPILYGSTFFLALLLGVLCEAETILNPKVLMLLVLGTVALFLSAAGGIAGGWILYLLSRRRFNPTIGIAGVSCVPTTAKIAQKAVYEENPYLLVLPFAMGPNISGVITSAIIAGIYVTLVPIL